MFKDQCWCSRHRVLHHCLQGDNVGATTQVFKDLNFSLDLLLLHRLKQNVMLKYKVLQSVCRWVSIIGPALSHDLGLPQHMEACSHQLPES